MNDLDEKSVTIEEEEHIPGTTSPNTNSDKQHCFCLLTNLKERKFLVSIVTMNLVVIGILIGIGFALSDPPRRRDCVHSNNDTEIDITGKTFRNGMRTLQQTTYSLDKIFDNYYGYHHDIFLFAGIGTIQLKKLLTWGNISIPVSTTSEQLAMPRIIARIMILDQPSHLDKIYSKTSKPVHLFHYNDNDYKKPAFTWIRSRGEYATGMLAALLANDVMELDEDEFLERIEKYHNDFDKDDADGICILGSPSEGQSGPLSYFERKLSRLYPERNVLLMDINVLISKLMKNGPNPQAQIENMTDVIKSVLENEFGINPHTRTELLLESFNELGWRDEHFAQGVQWMIENKFPHVRVWTWHTSPNFTKDVRDMNSFDCYRLKPMRIDEQVELFISILTQEGSNLDLEKIDKFARTSVRELNILRESTKIPFGDITFLTNLFAEAFEEEAAKFSSGNTSFISTSVNVTMNHPTNNSIGAIFERVIKLRIDKFLSANNESKLDKINLMNIHAKLSLKSLFPKQANQLSHLISDPLEMCEVLNIGILEASTPGSGSNTKFVHDTFPDYFVAWYLMNTMSGNKFAGDYEHEWNGGYVEAFSHFLLEEALSNQPINVIDPNQPNRIKVKTYRFNFPRIAYFLNYLIGDDNDGITKIPIPFIRRITHDIPDFKENWWKFASACVDSGVTQLFKLFHQLVKVEPEGQQVNETIFDKEFLLHCIERSGLEVFKLAIVEYEKYHGQFDMEMKTRSLQNALQNGKYSIVEYLIASKGFRGMVKEMKGEMRLLLHDCVRNSAYDSPAMLDDKIRILRFLTQINPNLLHQRDDDNETPLFADNTHLELLEELLTLGASALDLNNLHNTFFYRSSLFQTLTPEAIHSILVRIPPDQMKLLVSPKLDMENDILLQLIKNMEPLPETLDWLKNISGSEFNAVNEWTGLTLLEAAISSRRNADTLRKIITQSGANISNGGELLHLAAYCGNSEGVKLLVDGYGVDVNSEDEDGATPMDQMIKDNWTKGKKYFNCTPKDFATGLALLERGGMLNQTDGVNSDGQTRLHKAANRDPSHSNIDQIKLLILFGMNITAQDQDGNTPLHLSVKYKWGRYLFPKMLHLAKVELLLDNGGDPTVTNDLDETPFILAMKNRQCDKDTRELLQLRTTWTPEVASQTLSLVVRHYKDIDWDGDFEQFISLFQFLEEQGADLEVKYKFGNSLLQLAIFNREVEPVKFLVEQKGADINGRNWAGQTPLHVAGMYPPSYKDLEVIKYLIDKGADVNAKEMQNRTFLHLYVNFTENAFCELHNLAEYLVEKGHLDLFEMKGGMSGVVTPLELALQREILLEKTLELLQAHGIGVGETLRMSTTTTSSPETTHLVVIGRDPTKC